MTTVDTQIENALIRAQVAGLNTEYYAGQASSNVKAYNGQFNTPLTPPVYATPPAPPTDDPAITASDAALQGLVSSLDGFFASAFSPDPAYLAAQAWVINAIQTGTATFPNAAQLDTIWGRAESNTLALGNDISGLDIPIEATTTHTTAAYAAIAQAEIYAKARVTADMWRFAVAERIKDLRSAAITAAASYIGALANHEATSVHAVAMVAQAQTVLAQAAGAWYAAQANGYQRDVDRAMIAAGYNMDVDADTGNVDQTKVDLTVQAAIQGAQAVAVVAQAAMAAMNSVVMSSTAGFS